MSTLLKNIESTVALPTLIYESPLNNKEIKTDLRMLKRNIKHIM